MAKAKKPKSTSTHPTIGQNIRYFRELRELTLRQLAEKTDFSFGLIARWERREADPDYGQTVALARALVVPVRWLWDPEPQEPVTTARSHDGIVRVKKVHEPS